jgi:Endosomal/lysosomal potassium channel TMEM175
MPTDPVCHILTMNQTVLPRLPATRAANRRGWRSALSAPDAPFSPLEIRRPDLADGTHKTLAAVLLAIWPSYVAYVLSFVVIRIYWVNHHYIFKIYQHTDYVFNLFNVFLLLCISFLPFPTAVLGNYMLDVTARQAAVMFYTFGLLLPAVAWYLTWLYANHHYRLIGDWYQSLCVISPGSAASLTCSMSRP